MHCYKYEYQIIRSHRRLFHIIYHSSTPILASTMLSTNSSRKAYFATALHSALVLWTLCLSSRSTSNVSALQPPKLSMLPFGSSPPAATAAAAAKATAAATLAVLLMVGTPVAPAFAAASHTTSSGAAQIMVDQIPPTTISIQVKDIPVIGNVISGTYTKIDAKAAKQLTAPPSVVISSPKDKIKALKAAVTEGHIEIDVGGKVGLSTHLDIDLAADEAGVAKVRVASNLIPQLPFKNLASATPSGQTGKESQWNVVTNMGNGQSYYYNTKTGATQFEKPNKL